ncbi:type I restriction-modification enzyme R subunit C-terminal domain-containing protein [Planotetraspora sp. GP83]|uniref:type I restriction-modification enzyme R subunit C-terminal domain-containing protein n=1 Tax=Planotetraspora sp. GP83 TaxID=3156264 RepID=UPI0035190AE9
MRTSPLISGGRTSRCRCWRTCVSGCASWSPRFITNGFGTEDDIERAKNEHGGLGVFLRSLTGLDREAAAKAFDHFQAGKDLTANQLHFVKYLIDFLAKNGLVGRGALRAAFHGVVARRSGNLVPGG